LIIRIFCQAIGDRNHVVACEWGFDRMQALTRPVTAEEGARDKSAAPVPENA